MPRQYAAWVYVQLSQPQWDENCRDKDGLIPITQMRCEVADWLEGVHEFGLEAADMAAHQQQLELAA